jgi:hypothetical protein
MEVGNSKKTKKIPNFRYAVVKHRDACWPQHFVAKKKRFETCAVKVKVLKAEIVSQFFFEEKSRLKASL